MLIIRDMQHYETLRCHLLTLLLLISLLRYIFFFFNATATPEIYTLSLHDALPISTAASRSSSARTPTSPPPTPRSSPAADRKSTRLNSSHEWISYAVFCLKKKNGSP